jgi:uncharacterized protein YutE (UPF0331/DUF86 family)
MMGIDIERVKERAREIREWEIDPVRVLGYARENLGDSEDFLAAIESFVRREM